MSWEDYGYKPALSLTRDEMHTAISACAWGYDHTGDEAFLQLQSRIKKKLADQWDENAEQEAECKCGDPYYRHFDSYDNMAPVGCKYCECDTFVAKV